MTPTPGRRIVVVLLLAAVLLAAAVVDRRDGSEPTRVHALRGGEGPEAAAPDALSSSWYCPGGVAKDQSNVVLAVFNPTEEAMSGTLTAFPAGAPPVTRPLAVEPLRAAYIGLREQGAAPWSAALVDVDGGGAVVEQYVTTPSGFDTSPCAAAASGRWYFAMGSTAKDATLTLALFNPFPDGAIVDLAFATGEGRRVPGDFQGLVVPAGSVLAVDIGSHLRRQDVVSTEVKARAGRIVAGQTMVRTAAGMAGVSAVLGAPSLGETWYFADGLLGEALVERFELFNPTDREARVDVEVTLDQGEAEPFELTVPAQGRFTLVANSESRIPKDVAHAAIARSINGVPVVVQRVFESKGPRVGRSDTMGGRRTARTWAMAIGGVSDVLDEWVLVHNVGSAPATVSFTAMADGQRVAVEGLQGVVVPAGRRMGFRLGDHIKREPLPLVVEASRPVVVERSLFMNSGVGMAHSIAVPLD